jgi:hypothetical protein
LPCSDCWRQTGQISGDSLGQNCLSFGSYSLGIPTLEQSHSAANMINMAVSHRPKIHCFIWLVVWNHGILWLSIQLWMSQSQLTNSIIFQRGRSTTNQL